MYSYFIMFIVVIAFTLYYFNYTPFKEEPPIDTSNIENSINELKSLNQYINNGTTHRTTL
jgi:uncharacterized membrane protein YjfL (UPF0719 family)